MDNLLIAKHEIRALNQTKGHYPVENYLFLLIVKTETSLNLDSEK